MACSPVERLWAAHSRCALQKALSLSGALDQGVMRAQTQPETHRELARVRRRLRRAWVVRLGGGARGALLPGRELSGRVQFGPVFPIRVFPA